MAPMVHGLQAKYVDRVAFTYLDADDPGTIGLRRNLGFFAAPELYLLDGLGHVLFKAVGTVAQDQLEAELIKYLE